MDSRYPNEERGKHKRRDEHTQHRRHRSRSRSRSCSSSSGSSYDGRDRYRPRSQSNSSSSDREQHRNRDRHDKGESSSSRRNMTSGKHDRNEKHESKDLDTPVCPPPPIISKVSMSFAKPAKPVQMKLASTKPIETVKKLAVASAFANNSDDDDDEEESPPVKYSRNIGRETPTSSGPNSFGKTKQGFCDSKKIFEKKLREYKE